MSKPHNCIPACMHVQVYHEYLYAYTVNVEIFALYIFSGFSSFSIIRENIYNLKINFIIPHRGNKTKNANLSPREIANFRKFAKIYTHENIFVHSVYIYACVCMIAPRRQCKLTSFLSFILSISFFNLSMHTNDCRSVTS